MYILINLMMALLLGDLQKTSVMGVVDHGQVQLYTSGEVTEDTSFEIGSITKVFTTLLLMDMVNKGEVGLDDPVQKYLPDVKMPGGNAITLRHLATHYSGLPRLPDNLNPQDEMNPYVDYTEENLYHFLSHHILEREPGASFEYSNVGMGLLGHILTGKAGVSYEELVQERICKKLGMESTGITVKGDFAQGYYENEPVPHWDFTTLAGAGGLRSTVKDMTQFLKASMGLIDTPLTALFKQCQSKQFEALGSDVGLGWFIIPSSTSELICHDGGTAGFSSFMGFNLKLQKGVVILVSSGLENWHYEVAFNFIDPPESN